MSFQIPVIGQDNSASPVGANIETKIGEIQITDNLVKDNNFLRFQAALTLPVSASTTKTIRITFGGVTIFTGSVTNAAATAVLVEGQVFRRGQFYQVVFVKMTQAVAGSGVIAANTMTTTSPGTVDANQPILLALYGTSTIGNDIFKEYFNVTK